MNVSHLSPRRGLVSVRRPAGLFGAVVAVALAAVPAASADEAATFERLMSSHAASVVTLKFVLKVKSPQGEREGEAEATGVMIDPKGLVLCASTEIGGLTGATQRMLQQQGREISITPTNIKVLVGDDSEGVEARLLTRDTDLDLAWIQIKDEPKQAYRCVDMARAVTPRPGQRIYAVRRMDKYYDRATVISEGWIAGQVRRPRDLYVPGGTISSALGLPVFHADGNPVGILITQSPDEDERAGRGTLTPVILPGPEVLKATERARASAAAGKPADDADEDDDAPPAKPAGPGGKDSDSSSDD